MASRARKREIARKNSSPSVQQSRQVSFTGASFTGPLPPPAMLEHYETICPGFAERSLSMVEQQSNHRQGMERSMLDGKLRHESTGQRMAFVLSLFAFAIGGGALYLHEVGAGATIMGIDASTIIGMFIYREVRENIRRKENLPPSMPNL